MLLTAERAHAFTLSRAAAAAHAAGRRAGSMPVMRKQLGADARIVIVDGNNLMRKRRVTKGRDNLCARLEGISCGETIVVFDGRPEEEHHEIAGDPNVVVTFGGDRKRPRVEADDWIIAKLEEIDAIYPIEVITSDKGLRKAVKMARPSGYCKIISPRKWWRRYVPRLRGMKSWRKPVKKWKRGGGIHPKFLPPEDQAAEEYEEEYDDDLDYDYDGDDDDYDEYEDEELALYRFKAQEAVRKFSEKFPIGDNVVRTLLKAKPEVRDWVIDNFEAKIPPSEVRNGDYSGLVKSYFNGVDYQFRTGIQIYRDEEGNKRVRKFERPNEDPF